MHGVTGQHEVVAFPHRYRSQKINARRNLEVMTCPFAPAPVERHGQWQSLTAEPCGLRRGRLQLARLV